MRRTKYILGMLVFLFFIQSALAQERGRRRGPQRTNAGPIDRGNIPIWPVNPLFPVDHFTFARLKYQSNRPERSSFAWWTDFPDADLNLSFRLQELTSLLVNPEPKTVELTDPVLFDYPWVFMSGCGNAIFSEEEAKNLRRYLLNGGFMMVDDFWGQTEWDGFYEAIKQVFPEYEPIDIPRSHPLFHCVYDIPDDRPLQTPHMAAAVRGRESGITHEEHEGGNSQEIHFRGIHDSKGRLMVLICHNTDNGDGWEEEGADPWFFHEFSENRNYPLGINIIFYAMTH
ncbi:MAG: DUF4159 domain-containing protein [Verrucomicrobiales bacterium]